MSGVLDGDVPGFHVSMAVISPPLDGFRVYHDIDNICSKLYFLQYFSTTF